MVVRLKFGLLIRWDLEHNKYKMKCDICRKEYAPTCDFNQGRCPHHPPLITPILVDKYKMRFYTLLRKLIGLK